MTVPQPIPNPGQNSWQKDYLPALIYNGGKSVGRVIKRPFSAVSSAVSGFFGHHPQVRQAAIILTVCSLMIGGAFFIQAAPHLVNARFVQSIIHSAPFQFAERAWHWGKNTVEMVWQTAPPMLALAASLGAVLVLTDPSPSLWTSNKTGIVAVGAFATFALLIS